MGQTNTTPLETVGGRILIEPTEQKYQIDLGTTEQRWLVPVRATDPNLQVQGGVMWMPYRQPHEHCWMEQLSLGLIVSLVALILVSAFIQAATKKP